MGKVLLHGCHDDCRVSTPRPSTISWSDEVQQCPALTGASCKEGSPGSGTHDMRTHTRTRERELELRYVYHVKDIFVRFLSFFVVHACAVQQ